jgi:glutamine synthetase
MLTPRYDALKTATSRKPRVFDTPTDESGNELDVEEYFAHHVFTREEMTARLPLNIVERFEECIAEGSKLDADLSDALAHAIYQWALDYNASHFCHWFHPMTGTTAEKHDGFIQKGGAEPIFSFSGSELTQSEPDASSFPNGGSRSTFEARGYTVWDPSSPIFLMKRENGTSLCIPSTFVSYFGDVLDSKTPLLRSIEALNKASMTLCEAMGETDIEKISAAAGPEQEYFLIDKAYAALRPDLILTGRTVVGAAPPKGQSLDDHYFGSIPSRTAAFMHEVEVELYLLGIPAKTKHNEVAPSQFELAVVYSDANIAADHNYLVMEILERMAERHNFRCLLHEKPFAGINGSGKHINWSLQDNFGRNLLSPGKEPSKNTKFLAFLSSVMLGVYRNSGLLRASIGSWSNDFRLGANEAPPAIISVFLGEQLTNICKTLIKGEHLPEDQMKTMVELGVDILPDLEQDHTDRNRTSPFAFTGNKFEFRAAGSSTSISFPLSCINAAVSDGILELTKLIKEKGDVMEAIQEALRISSPVHFEGDNYSDDWVKEAKKRGLPHYPKTSQSLKVLEDEKTIELFAKLNILSPLELKSHYHVKVEQYINNAEIEIQVLNQMVDQFVLPAAIEERLAVCADVAAQMAVFDREHVDTTQANIIHEKITALNKAKASLADVVEEAHAISDEQEKAEFLSLSVAPKMEALRGICDGLELVIADKRWPLPRYREMLFQD